jgi:hypothetical protein
VANHGKPRKRYVVQTGVFRIFRCFESHHTAVPAYLWYEVANRYVRA